MNEEAFNYAYELFKKDGYTDSIDDFKSLIQTNNDAFDYAYDLFKRDGYADQKEDFKALILGKQQGVDTAAVTAAPEESQQPSVSTDLSEDLSNQQSKIGKTEKAFEINRWNPSKGKMDTRVFTESDIINSDVYKKGGYGSVDEYIKAFGKNARELPEQPVIEIEEVYSEEGKELNLELHEKLKQIDKNNDKVKEDFAKNKFEEALKDFQYDYETIQYMGAGGEPMYKAVKIQPTDEQLKEHLGDDLFGLYTTYKKDGTIDMDIASSLYPRDVEKSIANVKESASQIYESNLSREQRKLLNRYTNGEYDAELALQDAKGKIDENAFYKKTGRPLLEETVLEGKTYTPSIETLYAYGLTDNLPTKTKQKYIENQKAKIKANFDILENDANNLESSIKEFNDKYSVDVARRAEISDQLLNFDKQTSTQEEYNALYSEYEVLNKKLNDAGVFELYSTLEKESNSIKDRAQQISSEAGTLDDISFVIDATNRDYSAINRALLQFEKSFAGSAFILGAGALKLSADIINSIDETSGDFVKPTGFSDAIDNLYTDAINYNLALDKELSEDFVKNYSTDDFWSDDVSAYNYISQVLANNSPSIAVVLSTIGTGGLTGIGAASGRMAAQKAASRLAQAAFFTMEAGDKLSELEISQRNASLIIPELEESLKLAKTPAERLAIERQINELQNLLNAGMMKKGFTALMYGGIASYAEKFGTLRYIQNGNRFFNRGGSSLKKILYGPTGVAYNVAIEELEEIGTQLGHNFVDIALFDADKQLFDGVDKDFIANVGITSLAIQGPGSAANVFSFVREEIATSDEKRQMANLRNELISIEAKIRSGQLSPIELSDAKKRKIEIIRQASIDNAITIQRINNIMRDDEENGTNNLNTIFELARKKRAKIREIQKQAQSGDTSKQGIKYAQQLQDEYKELYDMHNSFASKDMQNKIKAAEKAGALNPAQSARAVSLFQFYSDIVEHAKYKNKNFKYFKLDLSDLKNEKEIRNRLKRFAVDALNDNSENIVDELFSNYYGGVKNGQRLTGNNGVTGKDFIVVFEDNIASRIHGSNNEFDAYSAAVTPLHELLHLYNKSNRITEENIVKSMNQAIIGLDNIIAQKREDREITEKQYEYFQNRKKSYESAYNKNEELITIVNDLIATNILSRSNFNTLFQLKTVVNQINEFFLGESNDFNHIQTGEDLYSYISSFQKKTKEQALKMILPDEADEERLSASIGMQPLSEQSLIKLNEVKERLKEQYNKEKEEYNNLLEKFKDKPETLQRIKEDGIREPRKVLAEIENIAGNNIYEKTQTVYDALGKDGSTIIARFWENEIERRLNTSERFSGYRLNEQFEDEKSNIVLDAMLGTTARPSQSIKGLIESYDGRTPINAYINKYINEKILDVIKNKYPQLSGLEIRSTNELQRYAVEFREEQDQDAFDMQDLSANAEIRREQRIDATPELINPLNVIPNVPNFDKEQTISNITSKINDLELSELTFNSLRNLDFESTANLFNVRQKAIEDKKLNLNGKEMVSAQNIFKEIGFKNILDLLPFATVPSTTTDIEARTKGKVEQDISDELIGISTGMPNNLLKLFYDKLERVKTPAGLPEWVKKETLSKEDIANALGFDKDGNIVNSDPRTPTGQNIKGMMELIGRLVTNKVVRDELSKQPEYRVYVSNIAAGKSPLMASQGLTERPDYRKILDLKKSDLDFTNTNQLKSARSALSELTLSLTPDQIVKYILPTISNQWGVLGKQYLYDAKTNDFISIVEDPETNLKTLRYFLTTGRKDFFNSIVPKSMNAKYVSGQQFVSFNNKPYNTLTGIINKQSAKGYVDGKFVEELEERVEFALDQRKGLKLIIDKLIELRDNGKITNNDVGMIMMTFNANVNSLVRTAAIPGFFQDFAEGKKPKTDEEFVYEHSLPARVVITELLKYINGKTNKSFDDILNNYRVSIISSKAHDIVNKYYKDTVPEGGWMVRYNNKEVKKAMKEAGLPELVVKESDIVKDLMPRKQQAVKLFSSRGDQIRYEKTLAKRRYDLTPDQIKNQVESIFNWLDTTNIPDQKKKKFEELALFYMYQPGFILPEDGYKIIEAERIASIKGIDPRSYPNPTELINEFGETVKKAYINPDEVSTLTNKRELPDNSDIVLYDVDNSEQGQDDLADIVESHLGKKTSPWCITAKKDGKVNRNIWDKYGNYKVAVFKNGKIISLGVGSKAAFVENKDFIYLQQGENYYGEVFDIYYNVKRGGLVIENVDTDEVMRPEDYIYFLNEGGVPSQNELKNLGKQVAETGESVGSIDNWWDKQDKPHKTIPVDTKNKLFASGGVDNEYTRVTEAGKKINDKTASKIGIKNASSLPNDVLLYEFQKRDEELTSVKLKASKGLDLSKDFNVILQRKHGIRFNKQISTAEARIKSKQKPRYRFWIPPSADDFAGLLWYTLPKGEQGEQAKKFYKKHLFDPFSLGERAIDESTVQMSKDYKELKKRIKVRPQYLEKKNPTGFTNEQSMRIWMFNKAGYEVPGLSGNQLKENIKLVENDQSLLILAKGIIKLMKSKEYTKPSVNWIGGSVANDMYRYTKGELRQKYMQQWQENADQIFTEQNLNKLEFLYGLSYRIALEDSLQRMKDGRNRPYKNDITSKVFDYLNGSTAAIMFFNTRSALLQLISNINFINWTDNNPLKAGAAFANQKQYWSDVRMLMNSNYLVARRKGLKINVSEAELADIAKTSKNKVSKLISLLLKKGYVPTQIADSIAIATGGATFYRNRVKTYLKEGLSQKEAEEKAYNDFADLSEESQQSSRTDKISMEQASAAGRVILNFANTSMQYARLTKKAALDLINNRGDWKTNASKILYYTFIQNLIFNTIQQAVFAMMFGSDAEDDDEEQYNKQLDVANGMANSILRGLGIYGATAAMLKDVALKIYKEHRKKKMGQRGEYERAIFELFNIAPPIDSKISKIRSALFSADRGVYDDPFSEGFSPNDPYVLPTAKVFTAITNVPLDRIVIKYNNIEGAMSDEMEMWQRIFMLGGWEAWQLGVDNEKKKGHTRPLTNQYGNEDYSRDYFNRFSED